MMTSGGARGGTTTPTMPQSEWSSPREIRDLFFSHHAADVARINHGSYGSCPAPVLAAQQRWRERCLAQPDLFMHKTLAPALLCARADVAALVHCVRVDELVLVDNATTAAAMVAAHLADEFQHGVWRKGDVVLISQCGYGAVRKAFERYVRAAGGRVVEVPFPFPNPTSEEIIESFLETARKVQEEDLGDHDDNLRHCSCGASCAAHNISPTAAPNMPATEGRSRRRRICMAVVDHISSMPSVVLPVDALVPALRSCGVARVFVDGAHAVGNVDVDVDGLAADFYTGNLHKWAFAPLSAAFLHCTDSALTAPAQNLPPAAAAATSAVSISTPARDTQSHTPSSGGTTSQPLGDSDEVRGAEGRLATLRVHHPIISHGYGNGWAAECAYVGTRDYSALLSVSAGLEFAQQHFGGLQALAQHNHERVVAMARMLAAAWGVFIATPAELCCAMAMVALPPAVGVGSAAEADVLRDRLREEFGVEAPVLYWPWHHHRQQTSGVVGNVNAYVRISHQVYNEEAEYVKLRDAVLSVIQA